MAPEKWITARERGFFVRRTDLVSRVPDLLELGLRKNGPCFEFLPSLCWSRACLGKMFVFTYKWLKKTVFTHRDHVHLTAHVIRAPEHVVRQPEKMVYFLSAFPMFVPSLSW